MSNKDIIQFAKEELLTFGMGFREGTGYVIVEVLKKLQKVPRHELQLALIFIANLIYGKPITPVTSDPSEWQENNLEGKIVWTHKKDPYVYSVDAGLTWQSISKLKEYKSLTLNV